MRILFFLFFVLVTGLTELRAQQQAADAIAQVLEKQAEAWNRGDLEDYMQGYWRSDSLLFIGKSGLSYGWQKILDNYRKSYPDREQMGSLAFDILQMQAVDKGSAFFVVGKWHLERQVGNLSGFFSLLWKKINGEWVIVADHSS